MIDRIEHMGKLIDDCSLPGEGRGDGVRPAHPNGIQLSRDRFMIMNSTLGFLGVDDARSGVYQVRADAYDGPVLREGFIVRSVDDWDPLNDGSAHVRQHGHFTALGVPRGAVVGGKTPGHANVFAVKWRRVARKFGPGRKYLLWYVDKKTPELTARTQAIEWMQCRLNDAGDDIEILQPARRLRQKGYEEGERFCSADVVHMNNPFSCPVPFNDDATEWIDCAHFDGGRIAPLKYRFNDETGVYEWVETAPLIDEGLFEASVARYRDSWIIAARPRGEGSPVAWLRTDDPFGGGFHIQRGPGPVQQSRTPLTIYTCPDGILRLLTGDPEASRYGRNRNPLYLWDVDPDKGFELSNRRVVFDSVAAGVPIELDHGPIVDMPKLLPHAGGRVQTLVHRVRSSYLRANDPDYGPPRIMTEDDFDSTAIYHARVHYAEDLPGAWEFA